MNETTQNLKKTWISVIWVTSLGILLNLITIPFALIDYYLWRISSPILSNITGILITMAFIFNTLYIAIIGARSNTTTKLGIDITNFTNFLMFVSIITGVGLFLLAIGYVFGFFVFLIYCLITFCFQCVIIKYLKRNSNLADVCREQFFLSGLKTSDRITILSNLKLQSKLEKFFSKGVKGINFVLAGLFSLLYLAGIIMLQAQLTGGFPVSGQVIGAAAGITSGFLALWVFAITAFTIRFFALKQHHPRIMKTVAILGTIFIGVFLLPVINRPAMIEDANQQFNRTFGTEWKTFSSSITSYTLSEPVVLSQFYYGYSWERLATSESYYSEISKYHLYANHSEYQLYYNVRYPKEGYAGPNSIGRNTTIILLHGGGWNSGNLEVDCVQSGLQLAGQGYVIFDVQYRHIDSALLDIKSEYGVDVTLPKSPHTQYNQMGGNYSIKDMIKDVGEFTHYLANLSETERYGARLDSVIMMGVSSGGHLAAISAYGYNNPYYAGNFSSALTIKAAVLYNSPNNASYFFYHRHPMYYPLLIRGSPDEIPDAYYYATPSNLITNSSVPTILFHGTIDKMVPQENSEQIYTQLQANGVKSVWIHGPFGGHGFDFGPNFSPIATYYLERFLYQVL